VLLASSPRPLRRGPQAAATGQAPDTLCLYPTRAVPVCASAEPATAAGRATLASPRMSRAARQQGGGRADRNRATSHQLELRRFAALHGGSLLATERNSLLGKGAEPPRQSGKAPGLHGKSLTRPASGGGKRAHAVPGLLLPGRNIALLRKQPGQSTAEPGAVGGSRGVLPPLLGARGRKPLPLLLSGPGCSATRQAGSGVRVFAKSPGALWEVSRSPLRTGSAAHPDGPAAGRARVAQAQHQQRLPAGHPRTPARVLSRLGDGLAGRSTGYAGVASSSATSG
jgi:hypothetical protein